MATKNKIDSAKKLVKKLNAETKKRNAAFDKLSPAEKRVFIARDVIAQLNTKKIVARKGSWINQDLKNKDIKEDKELKEIFDNLKTCSACAIGGLFVATVKINDRLKISEMDSRKTGIAQHRENDIEEIVFDDDKSIYLNDMTKYLGQFFSKQQLKLIEIAFEGGMGGFDVSDSQIEDDAQNFFSLVFEEEDDLNANASDMMRLIMENIIVNKGTFRPNKKPKVRVFTPGFIV